MKLTNSFEEKYTKIPPHKDMGSLNSLISIKEV